MRITELSDSLKTKQRLYCDQCNSHLRLQKERFSEAIEEIQIDIDEFPTLFCAKCNRIFLPDRSKMFLMHVFENARARATVNVDIKKKTTSKIFNLTKVQFIFDPDDYYYIPGLARPWDDGFLTPVFFQKRALLKYDVSPYYRLEFASKTYGNIRWDHYLIPFGINENERLVMWLGDIARLPIEEQYYLRSENLPSDHLIGSEFYDAQIECVFTQPTVESRLFQLRSKFLDKVFLIANLKIAHLDQEVMELATDFNGPTLESLRERQRVADALNKIYIESFDNCALGTLLSRLDGDPKNLGSLKRLEEVLKRLFPNRNISLLMIPFFALYDWRICNSHLMSEKTRRDRMVKILSRLSLLPNTQDNIFLIYGRLTELMIETYDRLLAD